MKAMVLAGLVVAGLVVAACSSASKGDASSPSGGDGEGNGETTQEEGGPESDYDRKLRVAKERREQCETLATAVQKAEKPGQYIVNLNDASKLNELATEIEVGLSELEKLEITVDDLEALRARYLTAAKEMAGALHETANAKDDKMKKDALGRYRKLDARADSVIEEINWACSEAAEGESDGAEQPDAGTKTPPTK
jgi:hypothetical protein